MSKKMKVMSDGLPNIDDRKEDVQVADDDGTGWCFVETKFRLGFVSISVGSDDKNGVMYVLVQYPNILEVECAVLKPNHATLRFAAVFNCSTNYVFGLNQCRYAPP